MFKNGSFIINQRGKQYHCRYSIKVYDAGSCYGINEGRISKLTLYINDKLAANYDRGWDVKPRTKVANTAIEMLLESYN